MSLGHWGLPLPKKIVELYMCSFLLSAPTLDVTSHSFVGSKNDVLLSVTSIRSHVHDTDWSCTLNLHNCEPHIPPHFISSVCLAFHSATKLKRTLCILTTSSKLQRKLAMHLLPKYIITRFVVYNLH